MIPFWVGLAVGVAVAVAAAWYARRRSRQRIARLLAAIASGGATSSGGADDLERSITKAVKQLEASKQSELESAHRELRLREQSLSGIAEGVVLLSDSRVVYANTAAEQILGNALSGGMLRHTVLSSLAEAVKLDGAQEVAFDDPINQRSLGASARTIDESGNTVVVVRDETEARRLAAVRRDFVADASHELKTPVAAIQAAIETVILALRTGDIVAAERFALTVGQSAQRLSNLVTDLLDLSRLETGLAGGEVVDIGAVVRSEVQRLAGAEPAPILLSIDRPFEVSGSTSDLALAVGNILSNAVRYTPSEGSITVRLIPDGGWITVEVADTGSGIPSKDMPRIFERFYRVDPARSRATGGTGLGLAIVRHVVELHGGSVAAASVLGEGSTFRIRLPLASVTT